ncbi:hypothetical protein [Modicisalibacter coralii]|uniref:hypothetical protein n=1 Tax=Modicisalibacter coralii TaxID=2304602 RepID=UPI00100A94BD|nr:hypothetical protein [Halomonas coralii]
MSMKPIEPGCLCIIIHPKFFGFQTTALERFGAGEIVPGGETFFGVLEEAVWRVTDGPCAVPEGWDFGHIVCESMLLRIDGGESLNTEAREAETA